MAWDQRDSERRHFAIKFGLRIAIASMAMLFAGFTSAYIVKKSDAAGWENFDFPIWFYFSTFVIIASSIVLHRAVKSFRKENVSAYYRGVKLTLYMGIAFLIIQGLGWYALFVDQIYMQENNAAAFFYMISGSHFVHVLGGVIILLITTVKLKRRVNDPVYSLLVSENTHKAGLISTYWHFVDLLWVYLFVFLLINHY